jgi:hypothetical protein
MKWFLGTYTGRFNRRHKLLGHLFSGRYQALFVDGTTTGYLKTTCDYVHLNPVRARLLARNQLLREFRWSSFPEYQRDRVALAVGAPRWQVSEPGINLWVIDTPITCQGAYGPAVPFRLQWKQRGLDFGANKDVFGFGPCWSSSWLSYADFSLHYQREASNPEPSSGATANLVTCRLRAILEVGSLAKARRAQPEAWPQSATPEWRRCRRPRRER